MSKFAILLMGFSIFACQNDSEVDSPILVALRSPVRGFDPIFSNDDESQSVLTNIYEPLYEYKNVHGKLEIVPLLASELPKINQRDLEIEIKLKKNILYHPHNILPEKRSVTGEDVIASWNRIIDPKNNSPSAWIFKNVESFATIDPLTIKIKLKKTHENFVHYLTHPSTSVVPHEIIKEFGKKLVLNPVGTGPYMIDDFSDSQILLKKFSEYHQGLQPDGFPILKFQVFNDLPKMNKHFISGNLSLLYQHQILKSTLDQTLQKKDYDEIDFSDFIVYFNFQDEVIGREKNKKFRKFLFNTLHKKEVSESIIPQNSYLPLTFFPPTVLDIISPVDEFKLESNDFKISKPLELLSLNDPDWKRIAELIRRQLAQKKIPVNVTHLTWPDLIQQIEQRKFHLLCLQWKADFPLPEIFLKNGYSKNDFHISGYQNDKYDDLYQNLLSKGNETILIQRMVDILKEDLPFFTLAHSRKKGIIKPWIENINFFSPNNTIFKYAALNKNKKEIFTSN